jgi:hypothetical protein
MNYPEADEFPNRPLAHETKYVDGLTVSLSGCRSPTGKFDVKRVEFHYEPQRKFLSLDQGARRKKSTQEEGRDPGPGSNPSSISAGGTERRHGAVDEEMATSSLDLTDGVPRCPSLTT